MRVPFVLCSKVLLCWWKLLSNQQASKVREPAQLMRQFVRADADPGPTAAHRASHLSARSSSFPQHGTSARPSSTSAAASASQRISAGNPNTDKPSLHAAAAAERCEAVHAIQG